MVQTHLANLCLRLVAHVPKKLLRPVYEGLHVQAVTWQGPTATLAVATETALQPLDKPAASAIPACRGTNMKI